MLVALFQSLPCVGEAQQELSPLAPLVWEQELDVVSWSWALGSPRELLRDDYTQGEIIIHRESIRWLSSVA